MQGLHLGQEAAVLRQVGLGQALHRQQAVFPAAIAQQSFLRRMDQRGFVVVGRVAAGVALDRPKSASISRTWVDSREGRGR